MATDVAELPRDTRMTLVRDEYLSEYDGRLAAGTVVLVDERTARRWLEKGIARPSEETDKTLREQKLAQLERLKAEIDEIPEADPNAISPVVRLGALPNGKAPRHSRA